MTDSHQMQLGALGRSPHCDRIIERVQCRAAAELETESEQVTLSI